MSEFREALQRLVNEFVDTHHFPVLDECRALLARPEPEHDPALTRNDLPQNLNRIAADIEYCARKVNPAHEVHGLLIGAASALIWLRDESLEPAAAARGEPEIDISKPLPCPFCGKQPSSQWNASGDDGYYGIDCCNAFAHAGDEESALKEWNRRVEPAAAEKAREQTKAIDLPGYVKPDNTERVHFYEQEFYVLSNFSAFKIAWFGRGDMFTTSEHVYHWQKFRQSAPDVAEEIRLAPSAHEAFKIAERNKNRRRPDWEEVKVGVMREILRAKADQHEYVRRKLLETGDRELVEDSWRDPFWGWGPQRDGQNMLGKLWMEIRAELRVLPSPPAATGETKCE